MPIEVSANKIVCFRCGKTYATRRTLFPVSHSPNYKAVGTLHICRECADMLYNSYLSQCNDAALAVRQMCRKLDLYWNEKIFASAMKYSVTRSVWASYITKVHSPSTVNKCYDDTLAEEGTMWAFNGKPAQQVASESGDEADDTISQDDEIRLKPMEITDDIVNYWGDGHTPEMYARLERSRRYWMKYFPNSEDTLDMGTDMLIKQICNLDVKISIAQAKGKSIESHVNSMNQLLGSLKAKPVQKAESDDLVLERTPYGVWIDKLEHHRPVSEPDEKFRDVDGIIKYISTWFVGHMGKMLGIKNIFTTLYEKAIARYRTENPEIDEEDDDAFLDSFFGGNDAEDNTEDNTQVNDGADDYDSE